MAHSWGRTCAGSEGRAARMEAEPGISVAVACRPQRTGQAWFGRPALVVFRESALACGRRLASRISFSSRPGACDSR